VLPKILHCLYDKDILEDSSILSWISQDGQDPDIKSKIRAKSKAFLTWLEQEDSESDE